MPQISDKNDVPASGETEAKNRLPAHIAFIMDGNGRWAQARGLKRVDGHLRGAETVKKIVEAAFRLGIGTVTLYAFSTENRGRPSDEIAALMSLLCRFVDEELAAFLKNGIRLRVIGDTSWLPAEAAAAVRRAVERSRGNTAATLVVALNYSSRDEVLRAAGAFARDVAAGRAPAEKPSWEKFASYLDTAEIPDPDLIVRTSGELRLSNFLMLQGAYSELYFCETLWPDFSEDDLKKALADYASRERRFGKTGDQLKA